MMQREDVFVGGRYRSVSGKALYDWEVTKLFDAPYGPAVSFRTVGGGRFRQTYHIDVFCESAEPVPAPRDSSGAEKGENNE